MQAAEMLGESSLLLPVDVSSWVAFEISWNTVIAEQNVYYFISIAHFTTKIFPQSPALPDLFPSDLLLKIIFLCMAWFQQFYSVMLHVCLSIKNFKLNFSLQKWINSQVLHCIF